MDGLSPHHYAGIDWASETHSLCVTDPAGTLCARFSFAHTAEGIAEAIRRLDRFGSREQMPIAIERPSGLLVDSFVDAGFPIVPIHPNALKATRPRYTAALGKADPGDSYILADVLRTDGHRFTVLHGPSEHTRALRAVVRTRDDLVATRTRIANQLRELLATFWPGPLSMFHEVESWICLEFLEEFPSPAAASRLGENRLQRFLTRNGYSGRRTASELLARLRQAPVGRAPELECEVKARLVRSLVTVLRTLMTQIREADRLIAAQLEQHPDAPIIQSFPRTGSVNAAQILAELGDNRDRFASFDQLAAEAGVCPVTFESGKHRGVAFRFACNKRLRQAITTWADNSRHASAWAAARYKAALQRGCDHPHAVRILARAWLRVLWRCWQDRVPYDPQLHGRALPFLAPQPSAMAA
jgi:transposase